MIRNNNYDLWKIFGIFESSNNSNLYFLSTENFDNKTLTPRIPSNYFTKNGFEDNKTPRICFSTSINGALAALSMNLKNKVLYVHSPEITDYYKPDISEVPDVKITNEVWVKEPTSIKCIGKIKVLEATTPHKFKYGNNEAELWKWKYEWIEKYN